MFETPIENAALIFTGAGFFGFALYCRLRGIFALETYYSVVGKTHLVFALVTVCAFLLWCAQVGVALPEALLYAAVVTFFFFFLHYAFFHQVVGLIKKSVSLNLLMQVEQEADLSVDRLLDSYGDGRGTEFLIESRIDQMRALGLMKVDAQVFSFTERGRRATRRYLWLKRFFGLQTPLENRSTSR